MALPAFSKLKLNYPGYKHHGGLFRNHRLARMIGCKTEHLLRDSSALRLSYALNKIGKQHSLGREMIRLSTNGIDSVPGRSGLQYIYHPIAYGPFMADRYGYPSVSKVHQTDPIETKKNFWGKQGILQVLTYTKKGNMPVGHVALWDCDHFYQSKDWIAGHSLITVEFWESPDSNCDHMPSTSYPGSDSTPGKPPRAFPVNMNTSLRTTQSKLPRDLIMKMIRRKSRNRKFLKKYYATMSDG